ncbi:uncharacterized protein [Triticum aestivum]|uniref:uncharacterized protein n=1 Tax=Triticum aestivum TaxID=4565 RepID=UPI001D00D045|nr:uncharacterized protein LOC123067046 [Triticum aestivum]
MSSLLWRSAAAAARRQLGRPPSARTTIRSMASSSSSSENTKGTSWLIIANIVVLSAWITRLNNKTKAHTEEIQRLQASNTELQDQLKRDLTSRRRATNRAN